jgi:hypothetical protein
MPLVISQKNQEDLLIKAAAATRSIGWDQDAKAFGLMVHKDGAVSMVAVFQRFTKPSEADLHLAKIEDGSMTRGEIEAVVMIAFHPMGLGLQKLWVSISDTNRPAQRAALAVGFDFEYRKRGGFLGQEDAIVMSMSRPDAGLASAKPHTLNNRQVTEG